METQRSRFEQLRRALDAAVEAPSEMIWQAVHLALNAVLMEDHVVWLENRELELQCRMMARSLVRLSSPYGSPMLRHFALQPLVGDDGALHAESLEYECPICRTRVDLVVGFRGKCSLGHVPALLVATVRDEEY